MHGYIWPVQERNRSLIDI